MFHFTGTLLQITESKYQNVQLLKMMLTDLHELYNYLLELNK